MMFLQIPKHRKSVAAGHIQIEQHKIDVFLLHMRDRSFSFLNFIHVMAEVAKELPERHSLDW